MLRYRLYDADAVISRSVTFGALTLLLLGIFAGSEKVIELVGERYFGEELGMLAGGHRRRHGGGDDRPAAP